MNKESLQQIIKATGRYPTSCKCKICRQQCLSPCLGTPFDVLKILKTEFASGLVPCFSEMGIIFNQYEFPILLVRPRKISTGCIYYKDGCCELHNRHLKLTEGLLSYHIVTPENIDFSKSLTWNIIKSWIDKKNLRIISAIFTQIDLSVFSQSELEGSSASKLKLI